VKCEQLRQRGGGQSIREMWKGLERIAEERREGDKGTKWIK
jgi:hypothetical protein